MASDEKDESQYCINPRTGRRLKIGNRTWQKLVKDGYINRGDYQAPNTIYEIDEEDYEDDPKNSREDNMREALYEEKEKLMEKGGFPEGKHPVIKRNKIVYQQDKLTNEESSRQTASAAMDVIDDIQNSEVEVPADMSREEAREYLQGLIFKRMLSRGKKFKNTKLAPTRRVLSKPPPLRREISSVAQYVAKKSAPSKKPRPKKRMEKVYYDDTTDYVEEASEEEYSDEPEDSEGVY